MNYYYLTEKMPNKGWGGFSALALVSKYHY